MSLWEQYPRSGALITFPSSFGLPRYHRKFEIILHTESDKKQDMMLQYCHVCCQKKMITLINSIEKNSG